MLKNYLKIAWRNLTNSKLYATINITGLAFGIASVLLIFLYIQYELSFDQYHIKKNRIYRITAYSGFNEKNWQNYSAGNPVVEMRNNVTGVEDAVRMTRCSGGPIKVGEQEYSDVDIFCTVLQPLEEIHFSSIGAQQEGDWQYVQILSLIALVILVLGCGNYMNLATARYARRGTIWGHRHRWTIPS